MSMYQSEREVAVKRLQKHHTDFDGNDQVKEDCQHESRQKYDNVTFWSGFEQITERSPLAHIVDNNKKDRGDRRHRDHSGIRHQNDKHDDKCDRVDHSGDRCTSAVFDIGSSSCDCSCCRACLCLYTNQKAAECKVVNFFS